MALENVFFYGTLMCPEVYLAVTGHVLKAEEATLRNYKTFSLKKRVYPGIIPFDGSVVQGLMTKVDAATITQLDQFEGREYERSAVDITGVLESDLTGWAYVLREDCYHILASAGWSFQNFLEKDLAQYLR